MRQHFQTAAAMTIALGLTGASFGQQAAQTREQAIQDQAQQQRQWTQDQLQNQSRQYSQQGQQNQQIEQILQQYGVDQQKIQELRRQNFQQQAVERELADALQQRGQERTQAQQQAEQVAQRIQQIQRQQPGQQQYGFQGQQDWQRQQQYGQQSQQSQQSPQTQQQSRQIEQTLQQYGLEQPKIQELRRQNFQQQAVERELTLVLQQRGQDRQQAQQQAQQVAQRIQQMQRQETQQTTQYRTAYGQPDQSRTQYQQDQYRQQYQTQQTAGARGQQLKIERAGEVLRMDVYNLQGVRLGDLDDIVLDARNANVAYIVLESDEGLLDKHYAVPVAAFRMGRADQERVLVLNMSQQQLAQAPTFDDDDLDAWPERADPYFARFLQPQDRAEMMGTTQQQPAPRAPVQYQDDNRRWDIDRWFSFHDPMDMRRLSQVIGMNVENVRGDNLGEVEDVAIDMNNGRVAYGILSYGGALEIGEDLAIVPWSALQPRLDDNQFVLNTQRESLQEFQFNERQDLASTDFGRRIHQQFNVEPYWTGVYGFADERQQQMRSGQAQSTQQTQTQQSRTIRGELISVGTDRSQSGQEIMRLRIRTGDGNVVTVHGGPWQQARQQNFELERGEQVTIVGSQTTVDNRTVIQARELRSGQNTLMVQQQGSSQWQTSQQMRDRQQTQQQSQYERQRTQQDQYDRQQYERQRDIYGQDRYDNQYRQQQNQYRSPTDQQQDRSQQYDPERGYDPQSAEFQPYDQRGTSSVDRARQFQQETFRDYDTAQSQQRSNLDRYDPGRGGVDYDYQRDLRQQRELDWQTYGTPGQQQSGQQQSASGQSQSISGTIMSAQPVSHEGHTDLKLMIQTDSGRTMAVVCDRERLEQSKLELNPGERVTIQGQTTQKDGQSTLKATQITSGGKSVNLQQGSSGQQQEGAAESQSYERQR